MDALLDDIRPHFDGADDSYVAESISEYILLQRAAGHSRESVGKDMQRLVLQVPRVPSHRALKCSAVADSLVGLQLPGRFVSTLSQVKERCLGPLLLSPVAFDISSSRAFVMEYVSGRCAPWRHRSTL